MSHPTIETEIKLPFESPAAALERLARVGAVPSRPRHFEDNVAYDRPDAPLSASGRVLRLRRTAGLAVLTFKALTPTAGNAPYKVREERETGVADADAMDGILARLGFTPCYRYQKYRTTFALGGLVACVDETPIGCFVELEGQPEQIDRVAAELGFQPAQYVRESYRELHERDAHRCGGVAGDLLFETSGR